MGQYFYLFHLGNKLLNSYHVAEAGRNVWGDKTRPSVSLYQHPRDQLKGVQENISPREQAG